MTKLWKRDIDVSKLNSGIEDTMDGEIGLKYTEAGDDFLKATLELSKKTRQPFGLLHGGASCVLAESMGSVASNAATEDGFMAVGMGLEAHHIRPVTSGKITGTCRAIHMGRSSHLWEIEIVNDDGKLTCKVIFKTAIIPK